MSNFQNENSELYLLEKKIRLLREIDSQLEQGILREQTPLEANQTLHGEADQELLNFERKILKKVKRSLLKQISEQISN